MTAEPWVEPRVFQEEEILRWSDVAGLVKLSRNTVRKLEKHGQFPLRFPLTDYSVGWLKSDVVAWMVGKSAAVKELARRKALR